LSDHQPSAISPQPSNSQPSAITHRIVAFLEVLICSDYPTQAALQVTFSALGYGPYVAPGQLRVAFVVGVSLLDAVLLIGLVFLFLRAHGERPRDVIVGHVNVAAEIAAGILLMFVALAIAGGVLLAIQHLAPSLHTVPNNPLQGLLSPRRNAWMFAIVVIVAGGVREEIQRAFLLHRFDQWLGGGTVGIIVTSVAFGAGHLLQGVDAAIAIGLIGAFWGVIYLKRRSAVAPIVSHSIFDLVQIAQFLVAR
jgi:membrane protease YdiL (CAAX protease family)